MKKANTSFIIDSSSETLHDLSKSYLGPSLDRVGPPGLKIIHDTNIKLFPVRILLPPIVHRLYNLPVHRSILFRDLAAD